MLPSNMNMIWYDIVHTFYAIQNLKSSGRSRYTDSPSKFRFRRYTLLLYSTYNDFYSVIPPFRKQNYSSSHLSSTRLKKLFWFKKLKAYFRYIVFFSAINILEELEDFKVKNHFSKCS